MTSDDRISAIREFIGQHVPEGLSDDQDIFDTTGVSSLFAVQLVVWVQRTFEVEVGPSDLDIANFRTVLDVQRFIERKLPAERVGIGD